jgi:hypothetical protein
VKRSVTWPLRAGASVDAGTLFVLKLSFVDDAAAACCVHVGRGVWLCTSGGLTIVLDQGIHAVFDSRIWECVCIVEPGK